MSRIAVILILIFVCFALINSGCISLSRRIQNRVVAFRESAYSDGEVTLSLPYDSAFNLMCDIYTDLNMKILSKSPEERFILGTHEYYINPLDDLENCPAVFFEKVDDNTTRLTVKGAGIITYRLFLNRLEGNVDASASLKY